MFFTDWFSSKKSRWPTTLPASTAARPSGPRGPSATPQQMQADASLHDGGGKIRRHARREQLYVAIREAMTRAGVLSTSYKFKVLSLDQRGNEFMVMMDVFTAIGQLPAQLGEVETQIIQHARARFEIHVPAVYWRVDATSTVLKPKPAAAPVPAPGIPMNAADARPFESTRPIVAQRFEPIQADEVTAFKQALSAGAAAAAAPAARGVQTRSGPRSHTLITGFEDTEMPGSGGSPVLSTTQYGDL